MKGDKDWSFVTVIALAVLKKVHVEHVEQLHSLVPVCQIRDSRWTCFYVFLSYQGDEWRFLKKRSNFRIVLKDLITSSHTFFSRIITLFHCMVQHGSAWWITNNSPCCHYLHCHGSCAELGYTGGAKNSADHWLIKHSHHRIILINVSDWNCFCTSRKAISIRFTHTVFLLLYSLSLHFFPIIQVKSFIFRKSQMASYSFCLFLIQDRT